MAGWLLWMVAQMPPPSITVDGVVSPGEDWLLLGVSTTAGDPALSLDTLWGYLTADTLYVAFQARGNFPLDTLVFVVPLDRDRVDGISCAYANCSADPAGFRVLFGNERATVLGGWDTLYFAPDHALVLRTFPDPDGGGGVCVGEALRHSGILGWTATTAAGLWACGFSSGFDTLVVEWKIAIQDLEIFDAVQAFHLNLYGVVKDQADPSQNSAVDCIPLDVQCGDAASERQDADTLSALVRLSRYRRTGEGLRITEVYYDAPTGEPEPASEFVEVLNTASDTADLSFFVFTDEVLSTTGEGRFQLPKDVYLPPGAFLILASDADSVDKYHLSDPADPLPGIYPYPSLIAYGGRTFTGTVSLANTGDDVHLFGGQVSPYDTTLLVGVDSVWYGDGGDVGSAGAAVTVPPGWSLERKTYGLWSGTPAQDFVQAVPAPGDLPPQFVQIGQPVYTASGGGVWVVEVVLGDTLPEGDTIQTDSLYYRVSTDGGSTWSSWTAVYHDSVGAYPKTAGVVQRYYYSIPDSAGGQPVTHVEYYARAWDAWGRAFGDSATTSGGVVTAVAEGVRGSGIRLKVLPRGLRLSGLPPKGRVVLVDVLGRRRGVFRADRRGELRIQLNRAEVIFLRLPGGKTHRVVLP